MHGDGPLRFTLGRRPPSGVVAMPLETFPRRPPAWSPTARRFSLWIPSSSSGSARDYTRYHYPDHRPRDAPRPSNTSLTLSLLLSLDVIRDISGRISLLSPLFLLAPSSWLSCVHLIHLDFSSPHLLLVVNSYSRSQDAQPDIPLTTLHRRHTDPRHNTTITATKPPSLITNTPPDTTRDYFQRRRESRRPSALSES